MKKIISEKELDNIAAEYLEETLYQFGPGQVEEARQHIEDFVLYLKNRD